MLSLSLGSCVKHTCELTFPNEDINVFYWKCPVGLFYLYCGFNTRNDLIFVVKYIDNFAGFGCQL